jgi:hypothetical protein
MLFLAAGRWVGIPPYGLAIAASAACILLLATLLLKLARRPANLTNLFAVVCLLLLAPQTFAAEAGFSVFAFALFLALMAALAYRERYGWAAFTALLLCLTRPDGVVFALPVLAVYLFRRHEFGKRLVQLAVFFLLPGLLYFLWRWHYFGYLLPLPFYVKSDTHRLAGILVLKSAINLAPPLLASCLVLAIALGRDILRRRNLLLFGELVLPSSFFYMTMRLDQNYASRFFLYPLVVAAVLLAVNYGRYRPRRLRVLLAGLGTWLVVLAYFWVNWAVIYTLEYSQPHVIAVSRDLSALPGRGSMIVSESGAIAYYSQWAAYDPWGLNTPAFAQHLIRPDDVAALHPDLVILHKESGPTPCSVVSPGDIPYTARNWENMAQNVIAGVDPGQYTQWLLPEYNDYYRFHPHRWNEETRYGKFDYQCWFVRKNYSHSSEVFDILKRHGGVSASDYVTLLQQGRDPDIPRAAAQ